VLFHSVRWTCEIRTEINLCFLISEGVPGLNICCVCVFSADIASQYQVSKYPTLKLFRYGQPTKREYRGQRSVTSIASFVEDQLSDPVHFVNDIADLNNIDVSPPLISLKLNCVNPLTPTDCHMGTAIKHPVPDGVKPSFVIFNRFERSSAQTSKNYK